MLLLAFFIQPFYQARAASSSTDETAPLAAASEPTPDESTGTADPPAGSRKTDSDTLVSSSESNDEAETVASETGSDTSGEKPKAETEDSTSADVSASEATSDSRDSLPNNQEPSEERSSDSATSSEEDDLTATNTPRVHSPVPTEAASGTASLPRTGTTTSDEGVSGPGGAPTQEDSASVDTATGSPEVAGTSTAATTTTQVGSSTPALNASGTAPDGGGHSDGDAGGGGSTTDSAGTDGSASGSSAAAPPSGELAASASSSASSSTPEASPPNVASSSASSTTTATSGPPTDAAIEPLSVTVESERAFAFNENECTRIADGSFYCQEVSGTTTAEDRLVALRDRQGDLEIYLVRDGTRTQLTDNNVDDASPHFDARSNSIVWHRLVNNRYEIMSYDLDTGEEEQITDTAVNDMEPARHGDRTVWQRWVVDNWEIMLHDGDTLTQLTESPGHDIDPQIRGDLIIWNGRTPRGAHQLMVYDATSGEITAIDDGEGVSVGNPRFVMMYETMYENGDVVTKGYDLETGEIVPLHSLPRELPDELPESDSTGETRALIQSKPTVKDSAADDAATEGGSGGEPDPSDAEDTHTLDLRTASDTPAQASTSVATPDQGDLVVPPATTTATGSREQ